MTIPEPLYQPTQPPAPSPARFWALVGGGAVGVALLAGLLLYFAFGIGRGDASVPPPQSAIAMASAVARTGNALELLVLKLRLQELLGEAAPADHARAVADAAQRYGQAQPTVREMADSRAELRGLAERFFAHVRSRIGGARWPADKPAAQYAEFADLKLSQAHRNFLFTHMSDGDRAGPLRDAVSVLLLTEGKAEGAEVLLPDVYDETDRALRDAISGGAEPARAATETPTVAAAAPPTAPAPAPPSAAPAVIPPAASPPTAAPPLPGGVAPPRGPSATPSTIPRAAVVAGAPPMVPPPPPAISASLAWNGMAYDAVGAGPRAAPDGRADGMFLVTLHAKVGAVIEKIELFTADADGRICCGQAWSSKNYAYWILGVTTPGNPVLYSGHATVIASTQMPVSQLVLFAADSGHFQPGQRYRVQITMLDGSSTSAVAEIR